MVIESGLEALWAWGKLGRVAAGVMSSVGRDERFPTSRTQAEEKRAVLLQLVEEPINIYLRCDSYEQEGGSLCAPTCSFALR